MDIAEYLTLRPTLYAVTKEDLGDRHQIVSEFLNPIYFESP